MPHYNLPPPGGMPPPGMPPMMGRGGPPPGMPPGMPRGPPGMMKGTYIYYNIIMHFALITDFLFNCNILSVSNFLP